MVLYKCCCLLTYLDQTNGEEVFWLVHVTCTWLLKQLNTELERWCSF